MKILRIFGLIGLVIFTILFMMGCGRGPGSDSTSNEYLKAISTISSSVINALKGTKIPILNHTFIAQDTHSSTNSTQKRLMRTS